ncbi:MAG: choice-of-anchor D domain-containing protein [Holophagales bacterium]|nr:choice-of-anchor D domain-containing protein [Holophagales bacterium]
MSNDRPIIRRRLRAELGDGERRTSGHGDTGPGEPLGSDPEATGPEGQLLDLPLGDEAGSGTSAEAGLLRDTTDPPSREPEAEPTMPGGRRPGGRRRGPWLPVLVTILVAVPIAAAVGYLLKPMPPLVSLSPDLVDFGQVPLGQSTEKELRLANGGEADLVVDGMTLVGEGAGSFRIVDRGRCQGRPMPADTTCNLGLLFEPELAGRVEARLVLRSNGAEAERTVPLLALGVAPELRAEPAVLDFGSATVGFRGERRQVRVENRGAASSTIFSVGLEGLAAADFVRFADRCEKARLGPGEACTVGFEFFPTAEAERRATLTVSSDAAPIAEAPVLIGQGLPQEPLLAVEPNRIDFGELRIGEKAEEAFEVKLGNEGNGPLEIRAVRLGVAGPLDDAFDPRPEQMAGSFLLEDDACSGKELEPGAGCRLLLRFFPQLEGALGALAEIEHSAGPSAHRLPLVGRGTAPRARFSASSVRFGEVPRGTRSGWRPLVIENQGTAALNVEKVVLRGADSRSFELSAEGCSRAPIPPGQSCSAEIRFRPRRDGPHRAEAVVRHDAGDGIERLALNGIGTSARLRLDPARLDFGTVRVSDSRQQELRLINGGRAPLEIERIRLEGDPEGELRLEGGCSGASLLPGRACTVGLRFTPTTVGARRASLRIEHGADTDPRIVPIEATALPRPEPKIRVEPDRLDFASRPLGDRGPVERVGIENPGEAPLSLRDFALEGPASADFELAGGSCGSTLDPGRRCTVGVAFRPSREGPRQAALVIRHDAAGGAIRLLLLGQGLAPSP